MPSNHKQKINKEREYAIDYFLYLWCGPDSPLFDKAAMTTFERYFLKEKETHHEEKGFYFKFREREDIADLIMEEFDVNSTTGHIINGHVPVHVNKGEKPIKANGKLMVLMEVFLKLIIKKLVLLAILLFIIHVVLNLFSTNLSHLKKKL